MKFRLMFKTPDVLDQVERDLEELTDEDERAAAKEVIAKFIENNEYTIIEFDTTSKTARVVEA